MKKIITFVLSSFLLMSCERAFFKEAPKTDPVSIYEAYWKIVSEKFSMFDDPAKNINKTALYQRTRARVTPDMSDDALFDVLREVVVALKDKHSSIRSINPKRIAYYSDGVRSNIQPEVVQKYYLKNFKEVGSHQDRSGGALKFNHLSRGEVGYMEIETFEDIELTSEMFDEVLDYFKDTKGLIIDVRGNGGGQGHISTMIPAHFTDKKIYVGSEYMKSGPGANDFKVSKMYLDPMGTQYKKPVIILMDTHSYSATSFMIAYFHAVQNKGGKVYFMGSKNSGGLGNFTQGYLANGWIWGITSTEFRYYDGSRHDNGIAPDEEVWDDVATTDKDEVIEKAIEKIKNW